MSKRQYKKHSNAFKKRVVLASLRQDKTTAELCQEFGVAESQIYNWRSRVLEQMEEAFVTGKKNNTEEQEHKISMLHQKIGQLTVERDFLENVWSRFQRKKGRR